MDDDKGLDLSLGLGGSSTKSNEKSNASRDAGPNGADRTSKILNDFRNFLNGGIPQQPQGSYFSSFPQSANVGHTSGDGNAIRFRTSTSSTERVVELDSEKAMAGDKRKNIYEEMNPHKKQESDRNSDLHDKGRTSHISITTDDGSTADNEDVVESEAATSRPTPNSEESSKLHVDSHASTDASKDLHGKVTASLPPYSLQAVSSLNLPSSITFKEAIPVGAPASSVYPVSGIIQPYMTGDRTQTLNVGNAPITFGYSHGQLPVLDKDSPWGMAGRPPLLNPYSGRPLSASGTSHGLSEEKQPTVEEGSSTRAEDDARANNSVFRGKSSTEAHTENSFPSEYPAIRPGMAADLKFGGSGSLPNLPWVSTTGPGPNGRTISGVTYRFSSNQIKIVCACHGLHMSPEDFIQHASEEPPSAADSTAAGSSTGGGGGGGDGGSGGLASFPGTSNASTSAKS